MRRVFSRAVSRWSRSPGCCGFRDVFWVERIFFPRFFHKFASSNSYIQSSQRRLGEGDPTASQSAHGELAPTYPHKVYRLLCSHLRNMALAVDQYSGSQHEKSVWSPQQLFKLRERQSPLLARQRTPEDIRKRGVEAYVLTPSISARRCADSPILCGQLTGFVRRISFRVLPARRSI